MLNKIKLYKNPARNEDVDDVKHYKPQYQTFGFEPIEVNNAKIPGAVLSAGNLQQDNPRLRLPSIGNVDHTWSGVDSSIIEDDLESEIVLDKDAKMIDNNNLDVDTIDAESEMQKMQDNYCVLMVNDNVISVASLEETEKTVSALVFGEHELCNGNPISIENILVLKKINIKVGVFLE